MRSLRFRLAGWFVAAALYVMPRGNIRDSMIDALDKWMSEKASDLTGERVTMTVHSRYR